MTELERHLAGALRALSEQYELEQRQQAGRTETLRKQMQALEKQVQALREQAGDLAGECRRLAYLLRGR